MPAQSLPAVLAALVEAQVEFIVFGAIALMAHGLVRATQDLDIFVSPDAQNVDRLRTALKRVYPEDASIDEISTSIWPGSIPPSGTTPRMVLASTSCPNSGMPGHTMGSNTRSRNSRGCGSGWRRRRCSIA